MHEIIAVLQNKAPWLTINGISLLSSSMCKSSLDNAREARPSKS